jgi:hypothetical protein
MNFNPWNFKDYGRSDWIGLAILVNVIAFLGTIIFLLLVKLPSS